MHCFFVAGDIADRYNRRGILAISYAVQALAAALLLALTRNGGPQHLASSRTIVST